MNFAKKLVKFTTTIRELFLTFEDVDMIVNLNFIINFDKEIFTLRYCDTHALKSAKF